MATYLAITTTNPEHGYEVLAYGSDKEKVREAAEEQIGDIRRDYGTDIYAETRHKNLRVVSKTKAKLALGIDYDDPESFWLHFGRDAMRV